jgi:glycosyltransferase involved in cell wall biosynthesis
MRLVRLPTIRSKHLETLVHTFLSTIHALFGDSDIVHYHCLGAGAIFVSATLVRKKNGGYGARVRLATEKMGRIASAILRLGKRASIKLPDLTMVVSRTLQDYNRSRYATETAYVPNGTTLRQRRAAGCLQGWDLEPGQYILFLGRFSLEKNCDLLIQAYEQMDTPVKLVLAGGTSHAEA